MKRISFLLIVFLGSLGAGSLSSIAATAQKQVTDIAHTPKVGSAERKAIMDVLREEYKGQTADRVTFKVHYIKVHGGWAWADVTPLDEKGKAVAEGGSSLLHQEQGKWVVIDLSTIEADPNDPLGAEDASPGFIKNLRKKYSDIPTDIFPKKHG